MDTFGPRVVNPKVIRMGRRYSLVHRPGLYLINDTKDPNAPGELFPAGERSQALRRYRQLEAHSKTARLRRAVGRTGTRFLRAGTSVRAPSRRDRRGVLERGRNVDARSRVAPRRVSGRRGRTLVPIVGVVSLGVLIATLLILVQSLGSETADPAFSLEVGEVAAPALAVGGVAAPTLTVGSGDPPRAELPAQVDQGLSPGAPDGAGHRHEAGRGDGSVASDSDSPTGSSAGSDSTIVQVTVSGDSGSDTSGGSGSGSDTSGTGSGDSGSVDQGGGGSSGDSGSGPGGAGPGGGSVDDGGGAGTGGGGGGGG